MFKSKGKIEGVCKICCRTFISFIISTLIFENVALADDNFSSFLPFGKQWAIEKGGKNILPLPVGMNANVFYQEQDLMLDKLSVSSELYGPFLQELEFKSNSLESKVITYTLKLDTWVLPFLNVYTIIGSAKGETSISAEASHAYIPHDTLVSMFGGEEFLNFNYNMDYNGFTFGYGSTLAGGIDNLFGSLDVNYTDTNLDISDSSIKTLTITPRVGWIGNFGFMDSQIWVGTMYQDTTESVKGTAPSPGNPAQEINFDVTQEAKNNWNYLFGGRLDISKVWHMLLEVGAGDRTSIYGSFEYRF